MQIRLVTLRQLSIAAPFKTMVNLATAIIVGKLSYGIQVWGGTSVENRTKLQKILNQAAKIVIGSRSYKMSTPQMMKELGWSSIDQLIDHHTANLAVNILQKKQT